MSDLVERLRNLTSDRHNTFEEAADAIERKDAAIAELVRALKWSIEVLENEHRKNSGLSAKYIYDVKIIAEKVVAKYNKSMELV